MQKYLEHTDRKQEINQIQKENEMLTRYRIKSQNAILTYELSSQILHLGIFKITQVDKTQASRQKLTWTTRLLPSKHHDPLCIYEKQN